MGKSKKEEPQDPRLLRVGEKLKKLRISKGYTSYEQFAFEHNLPRSGYGDHEKGKNMTLNSLLRILDIHNIKMSDFFDDLD
ncbi:MAG: helix-turn-helix transcriptional regulator [Cytophagaceae bacterium]